MGVPQHKRSKSRNRNRRAVNEKLKLVKFNACPQCQEPKMPHHVCSSCGFYREREEKKAE
ncbi:50S ribosomal protein L32 [Heliorestis acidaminivorans]|uniref:Large ribosomal subunit protein bL32 n=1 Tax=Heliorestis acidaminivorans TaxID=553427 RepID=A0A6I0EXE8_9FIRM|nr:50S ribosomal protein L32 [Heliorestis acidaminivorans]KAB2954449.1 50S ribosomal protein L32 [Heliorestis acidaminivorans]